MRTASTDTTFAPIERRPEAYTVVYPVVGEHAGREVVAEAIARHKAAGRAIYYKHPEHPDLILEEHPDGRRFVLREDEADRLEVVCEIPPR